MKDFSPNTCFLKNQTKHTAIVGFHRKNATSIEAVIEFKCQLFSTRTECLVGFSRVTNSNGSYIKGRDTFQVEYLEIGLE